MTRTELRLPELAAIAVTRGLLGAGIGLLVADRLGRRSKPIGWTLAAIGALSTIPLAYLVFSRRRK